MQTAAECSENRFENSQPSFQLRKDSWKDGWLLCLAAVALGIAIQIRDGLYDPVAFIPLTIALLAALAIYLTPALPLLERLGTNPLRSLLACAIATNFLQLFLNNHPGSWHGPTANSFFHLWLTLAAAASLAVILLPRYNKIFFLLALAAFCINGIWIIHQVPQPYMDVWMLQTEGVKAFLHGHNPYGTAFPDIYHHPELYGPGAIHTDNLVHLGFPYPPIIVWLDSIGYALAHDYRYTNLAAIALSAVLIAFSLPWHSGGGQGGGPSRPKGTTAQYSDPGATVCTQTVSHPSQTANTNTISLLAALLFLFTPRVYFVLESGWTEPINALLLIVTVVAATRQSKLMPVFLGLFLCSKQYLVWAAPPILLLAGYPTNFPKLLRIIAIAAITACIVSLPLILWNPHAYLSANIAVAQQTAVRSDALSYITLLTKITHWTPSTTFVTVIGCGLAAITTLLVCLRGPRTPAAYAAAVATAHLVFFSFYKFAFCNYNYFLIAAFCIALATLRPTPPTTPRPQINSLR